MKHILLGLALLVALTAPALAVEPAERLADPALEARARAVGRVLRCLVCQNESIDESAATLAHDIRVLLRERIAAGDTDAQATQFIVDRYGQFVLLTPPVEPATYILWFGPPILLIGGAAGLLWRVRRRAATAPPAPLDANDRQQLEALLRDADK